LTVVLGFLNKSQIQVQYISGCLQLRCRRHKTNKWLWSSWMEFTRWKLTCSEILQRLW